MAVKAQDKSSNMFIQVYTWGDSRVLGWQEIALQAETSVQETEPGEILLWLPSTEGLKAGKFKESEVALAVIQWIQELGRNRACTIQLQCKTPEAENIIATINKRDQGKIEIFGMTGKALKKVRGDIPDLEKVKKYQLGINDFEQAAEIRLTLPVNEAEDRESVNTMAHPYTPTPELYELNIGEIRLLVRDSLIEKTEGGIVILNGNKQMITGSGTAEAIFSRLGTPALQEIEKMRAQLGPQNAATVRMTSGLPQWNFVAHTVMTDCREELCSRERSWLEARTITAAVIRETLSRNESLIHMTLMGTGQFKHPVTSVIEGIISGITDMSQEGQVTINLLMSNTNREELEKILKRRDEQKQPGPSHPSAPQWDGPRVEGDLQEGETESEFGSEMSELDCDSDTSDSLSSCTNSDSSEADNIDREARLRNKKGSKLELKRVTHQIENDWPEVVIKGTKYKNPTSEKRGRTLTKKWDQRIIQDNNMTYGQMRSASRSPSARRVASTEGWSKTGKQILFQEGYEYTRKVVKELEKVIKSLKSDIKSLKKEIEMLQCQKAITENTILTEPEDWESANSEPRKRVRIRPATPGFKTPIRQLKFDAPQETRTDQNSVHAKLLELQLTEAVRKQVGGRKMHEDPSAYADRIMKAAENAQLSRDAATRLVQTCTGHPISAEALGRMRNLTGFEDKFIEWEKSLVNAQKEQVPLLGIWLSIEQEIPATEKVPLLRQVGRKIPGGQGLITLLNNATSDKICERLAEYDLGSRHVKAIKKMAPQNIPKQGQQNKKKFKNNRFQVNKQEGFKRYDTRFQSEQRKINKLAGNRQTFNTTKKPVHNISGGKQSIRTPLNTSFIPADKWEEMTPVERSKVIEDRKNKTNNSKKVRRNKVVNPAEQHMQLQKEKTDKASKKEKNGPDLA